MCNYTNSCFVRLLIVNPRNHDLSVLQRTLTDKQTLRGLRRPCDLSVSLAEGLSARGGQNCVRARARGRVVGASPARGRRAVPPRLSLG